MKYFTWDETKNEKLKAERGIGFEEIVFLIAKGDLLDVLEHPNQQRYRGQSIFVVRRDDYVHLVPFVEDERVVFLQTIIPSERRRRSISARRPKAMKLDREERGILESVESGEWKPAKETKRNRYAGYAKDTFRKDRRVNIRISSRDLEAIQTRALEEGLPYQTLIASLLHKYASGRLREA